MEVQSSRFHRWKFVIRSVGSDWSRGNRTLRDLRPGCGHDLCLIGICRCFDWWILLRPCLCDRPPATFGTWLLFFGVAAAATCCGGSRKSASDATGTASIPSFATEFALDARKFAKVRQILNVYIAGIHF